MPIYMRENFISREISVVTKTQTNYFILNFYFFNHLRYDLTGVVVFV